MWKSMSVSWRKMKEEKLLTMDVHANQWQLSREPTTRASSPACEPATTNDDGNQGSDSWIHDVLRGKSGWRCCWEPRLAQWREWRGVAWWLVRENEIVFRSRYIVDGSEILNGRTQEEGESGRCDKWIIGREMMWIYDDDDYYLLFLWFFFFSF